MKCNFRAMGIAAVLTFLLITILTIQTELSAGFKTSLAALTGHHWTSKGVVSLLFFTLSTLVLGTVIPESKNVKNSGLLVVAGAIVCGFVIFAFFVNHFLAG